MPLADTGAAAIQDNESSATGAGMFESFSNGNGVRPDVIDGAGRADARFESDEEPRGVIESIFLIVRTALGNAIDLPAPGERCTLRREAVEFHSKPGRGAFSRSAQD